MKISMFPSRARALVLAVSTALRGLSLVGAGAVRAQEASSAAREPPTKAARMVRLVAASCGLLLAAPAWSQVTPNVPPLVQAVDRNGVDLLSGSLENREVHATIGGEGAQGLSEIAFDTSGMFANYFVSLPRGWNAAGNATATVGLGGASLEFMRFSTTPNAFVDSRKTGGTLRYDSGPFAFVATAKDGTVYKFSARYTLPAQQDQDAADLNYAAIDSITYPTGEVVTFYYRDSAYLGVQNFYRLQSVVSSLGYQLKYEYASDTPNAFGWQLVNKVAAINMAYDTCDPAAAHCTLTNIYPTSTYGRNYDQNGTGGQPYTYTYDDAMLRRTTQVVTATPTWTRATGATKTTASAYDSYLKQDMITSVTDGVGTWTYQFSPVTNKVTVTDPLSHATIYTVTRRTGINAVTDALGRQTTYTYDVSARLIGATFPEGNGAIYTRDDRNNVTQTGYYAKDSGGVAGITTSASFDVTCAQPKTCNQPRYTIDARGARTDYTYDDTHGGVLTKTLPAGPNGIRPTVTYTYQSFYPWYRNAAGVLTQAAAPVYRLVSESTCQTQATCAGTADEVRTTYVYGAPGTPNNLQVTAKTMRSGDGVLQAAITYTPAGDVKTIDGPLADDTVTYFYNAARQKIGEVGPDPDGAGPLKRRAIRTTYNAGGLPGLVEQGTVEGVTDADWAAFAPLIGTSMAYDTREHKVQERLVSGGTTQTLSQYSYDAAGRQICATVRMNPAAFGSTPDACALGAQGADGPDRITYSEYDSIGRLTKVTSGYGTSGAYAPRVEKTVTYTANGLEQTVADGKPTGSANGRGNLTTYEYDGLDRLVKVRYPNASGTGSSNADYDLYGYDAAGNRTSWRRRDETTATFTYDALNRVQNGLRGEVYGYDNLGRRTSATYGGNAASASFDALGRMTSETINGLAMSYQYDLAGNRKRITWPDGSPPFFVTYDYDNTGAMTAIRENGEGPGAFTLATLAYDDLGRRTALYRANSAQSYYGYDAASRLSSLTLDLAGTAQDQTWTFAYNAAGQVKTRTASNGLYEWGAAQASKAYTVNGLNQYATVAETSIGYDGRGNLTNDGTKTYGYDLLNNLTSAGTIGLTYEPTGRLWSVVNGATTTLFLYSGSDMVAEINPSAQILRRYVPGPGTDEPIVWYEGSGVADRRFLQQDAQGSVVATSIAGGYPQTLNKYDEYGVPDAGNVGRFQYTGQAWIPEVGLYHYKARAYSPTLGRFLQIDPIGYGDGLNWYAYVGNDPLNRSDPTGNQSIADIITGVIHGSNSTVQASASLDAVPGGYVGAAGNAIPGGTASVGLYAGRGPKGDFRVGVSATAGPAAGRDVSAAVGVTVYKGDTSNIAGASTQVQGGGGVLGSGSVTAGQTATSHTAAGGGTTFTGVAVGIQPIPGITVSASRTETAAGDISVPMSPTAVLVSGATTIVTGWQKQVTDFLTGK